MRSMPTMISHAVVALGAGAAVTQRKMPFRSWACGVLASIILVFIESIDPSVINHYNPTS